MEFNDFVKIDDHVRQIKDEPWSMYWGEQQGDQAELFSRDPVAALKEQGIDAEGYQIQMMELNGSTVSSSGDWHCKIMMVLPEEKLAFVASYRHHTS
ncbi:hypothetical protein [Streptomyces goshikiensis]|uniref:hypothetical protein n=1 Tax=Streptomyces goshikiensis TaxID=1942 RepID=UPI00339EA972